MFGHYLHAHWRGEHSLARSFWINGALLNVALGLIFLAQEPFKQDASQVTQLSAGLVLLATGASIAVWQFVGIWRSATYSARVFWPVVAKLMVVLGAISSAGQIFTTGNDSINILAALRDPNLADYVIERRGSTDLLLTGAINDQSVAEVIRGLADPSIKILRVNSHGGVVGPSIKLARHIRANGIMVMAEGECVSACVMLLAASPTAAISAGTVVTFHRFQPVAELSNSEIRLEIQRYLREAGSIYRELDVADWAIEKANKQEFWTPSLDELIRMNLVIQVYDRDQERFVRAADYCVLHPAECGN